MNTRACRCCNPDCAAHALGISAAFIITDTDRLAMKFSFQNGTNDCLIHGPAECSNLSETAVDGWGYFGVFDGTARRVWTQNSTGHHVLLNNVASLADNAAFRETCVAGEIRGLWDRHGVAAWSTDSMMLCTALKANELCATTAADSSLGECIALAAMPDGFGGGGDGRVYRAEQGVVGVNLNEFLAGTTDNNRDVGTQPVWGDRLSAITAAMEAETVRDLPVAEKKQIFDRLPEVKQARREAKEIVNTRKVVTTVTHPKRCLGDSEFCTVVGADL